MSEKPPSMESAPQEAYEIFEGLIASGEWTPNTEDVVRKLLESHKDDMYMIYLNYVESGILDDGLPDHEQQMFNILEEAFEGESE